MRAQRRTGGGSGDEGNSFNNGIGAWGSTDKDGWHGHCFGSQSSHDAVGVSVEMAANILERADEVKKAYKVPWYRVPSSSAAGDPAGNGVYRVGPASKVASVTLTSLFL
jgi:hypothetical protein